MNIIKNEDDIVIIKKEVDPFLQNRIDNLLKEDDDDLVSQFYMLCVKNKKDATPILEALQLDPKQIKSFHNLDLSAISLKDFAAAVKYLGGKITILK